MRTYVYFIRSPESGLIKIGYSMEPQSRLRALQIACGHPLELLAAVDGGRGDERSLHDKFKNDRALGEWFRPTDQLVAYIGCLKSGREHLPGRKSAAKPKRRDDRVKRLLSIFRVRERDIEDGLGCSRSQAHGISATGYCPASLKLGLFDLLHKASIRGRAALELAATRLSEQKQRREFVAGAER